MLAKRKTVKRLLAHIINQEVNNWDEAVVEILYVFVFKGNN